MSLQLKIAAASFVALGAIAGFGTVGEDTAPPTYEVTAVKGKLMHLLPTPEERLQQGSMPSGGDVLRTGSRSSAEISSPGSGARFTLGSKTRVRLASEHPGVLLEVERGRLRALFDKLAGDEQPDRLVTTPSAVLAVRGTEYGVAVAKSGDTSVVVFAGEVEVMDSAGQGPPVVVRADHFCTIPRGGMPGQPTPHGMGSGDWDHGRMPGAMSGAGHGSERQDTSRSGSGGTSGRSGGSQGGSGQQHGGAARGHGG